MKRDIERQLKTESENYVPDVYDRVLAQAEAEGLFRARTEEAQPSASPKKSGKRFYIRIAASLATAAACLAIVIPVALNGGAAALPPQGENSAGKVISSADFYGVGAVSTVRLLGASVSPSALSGLTAVKSLAVQKDDVKDYAEKFNEYFTALDCFLGEDVVTTYAEENINSDYGYETKLTVTGKDLSGNDVVHVMYYTETPVKEGVKKSEYTLEGVMIIDGTDYYLTGEREHEEHGSETEEELKIRAYADAGDKRSYVEMVQESSVEKNETEKEYTYSVYSDGKLVERTSVEFETSRKGDKEKAEYELEFVNGSGKGKYKVERSDKDEAQMLVKYDISGDKGTFTIRLNGGRYEYVFSDNTSIIY